MRGNNAAKQLVLITALTVILIVCVGVLIFLNLFPQVNSKPVIQPVESSKVSVSSQESSESEQPSSSESSQASEVSESSEQESVSSCPPQSSYSPPVQWLPSKPTAPVQTEIVQVNFDKAGGDYEEKEIIKNGYITVGQVAVRNKTFNENLYITKDAKADTVLLQNVIVKGKIIVRGGGTIKLHNVTAAEVDIQNEYFETEVIVSGNTTVDKLVCRSHCVLDEYDISKEFDGVKNVVISDKSDYIWINFHLAYGALETVSVNNAANVNVGNSTNISLITANKKLHIKGAGNVDKLDVFANDVTYVYKPINVNVNGNYSYPERSSEDIGNNF